MIVVLYFNHIKITIHSLSMQNTSMFVYYSKINKMKVLNLFYVTLHRHSRPDSFMNNIMLRENLSVADKPNLY